jgi:predicted pyridoxine 5'-phosphate oxidase superfamily flavin-nucleotide-binding protein
MRDAAAGARPPSRRRSRRGGGEGGTEAHESRAGSLGERELQERYGTRTRADAFYREQVLDHLNEAMRQFVARMEMVFVATADARGNCDCSIRTGLPGFVRVLDERTLACPEYRGNGVMASQGNIAENGHAGLLFVDFFDSTVGLHVNGRARIVENEALLTRHEQAREDIGVRGGRHPERWIVVEVDEAYIHCSKHLPLLAKRDKAIAWGTDDPQLKGGDYFGVSASRRGAEGGQGRPASAAGAMAGRERLR